MWMGFQLVHDRSNVHVGDVPEPAAYCKVLPYHTVGVFVQTAIP